MALGLLAAGWRTLGPHLRHAAPGTFVPRPIARMVRVGLPLGAQYLLEYGAFAIAALLMGMLGTAEMAAHQIAINIAALTFMVPLGISTATSVLVGHAVGAGDEARARRAAVAGFVVGVSFMSLSSVVLTLLPGPLARAYTGDATVVALAATLIPLAGVFQVFDGTQVVAAGVLRGIGDTTAPMVVNILGFWCVGLPAGAWLAFGAGGGARGLWWGLVAGLAAVAALLLVRVRLRLRRRLVRVVIDDRPLVSSGAG
jgi:MATE family multidrug resistance protein